MGPDVPPAAGPRPPETLPLLRDHAQQDWRDVLARVDVPFLMMAGRDSQHWPCEHAAASVGSNAHGTALVLEDCGHAMNIDQPDEFNDAPAEVPGRAAMTVLTSAGALTEITRRCPPTGC